MSSRKYNVGIIGTGFIAKGFLMSLMHHEKLVPCGILTRRPIATLGEFPLPKRFITNDLEDLIRASDVIVECTGDAIYGTDTVERALKSGLPVVTLNPELQITSGTVLSRMGTLIEAEGDQPGTIAALATDAVNMGFKPVVYGNIKRFLNHTPTREDMEYWSKKQGISLEQVTAFTDGSKVQIEQALVANGLGATIMKQNLTGVPCTNHEDGAQQLAALSKKVGGPISDYVLSPSAPAGVFIVATHDQEQQAYLEYLKLGKGPFYTLTKPHHLCHLEIVKTVWKVLSGDSSYAFNNGQEPTVQVASVAKRKLQKREVIRRGLGGFEVRGEAVLIANHPDAVPITLMNQAEIVQPVEENELVTFAHVKLPKSRALQHWKEIVFHATGQISQCVNETHEDKGERSSPRQHLSFIHQLYQQIRDI